MAHEIASMAYRDTATPWHGLGKALPAGKSIEDWQIAAGMDWEILEAPCMYAVGTAGGFNLRQNPDRKVLFRSDSNAPLSVVSTNRYQVVQPREVLEFYRDLVVVGGFELETAGVLKGGKKLWALARTNQSTMLKGKDTVNAYLLLATSCDGTLSTQAFFTSIRVVCSNTLQMAVNGSNSGVVKVPHSTKFDPMAVKKELGLGMSTWDKFARSIKDLAARPVSPEEARTYLVKVLGDPTERVFDQQPKPVKAAFELYSGNGLGSDMASAKNTAWGLVNAVTQFEDWARQARTPDSRLDSAWFGAGASNKARAFQEAMALLA